MAGYTNQFLWYELMTTDVAGAEAFYTDVVGWKTDAGQASDRPYTMWRTDGEHVGGLMALPESARQRGAPSHWLGYVGADDVDAAAGKAKGLGATVLVPPTDIPGVGRFAVLADPQGAVFALFGGGDPAMAPPPNDAMKPGRVAWHELLTTDDEGGWSFYHALFGWTHTETMDMGEHGAYRMFTTAEAGTRPRGGMMRLPDKEGHPGWLYYFTVPDLDAAVAKLKAGGGQLMNGPMEVPGGDRVAQCTDPQGAWFALHAVGG